MAIRLRLPGPMRWSFPDDAVIEYEPETGALTATGIQTATIKATVKSCSTRQKWNAQRCSKLRSWKSKRAAR